MMERESIWSVPAKLRALYYSMFSVFMLVSVLVVVADTVFDPDVHWGSDRWIAIGGRLAPMAISSAALGVMFVEVVRVVKVLGKVLWREINRR